MLFYVLKHSQHNPYALPLSFLSHAPPPFLQAGLEEQLATWCESTCIGDVVLKQSDALLRVYPTFVNFFDLSKEALQKCDKNFPRFHAFLKVCVLCEGGMGIRSKDPGGVRGHCNGVNVCSLMNPDQSVGGRRWLNSSSLQYREYPGSYYCSKVCTYMRIAL